MALIHADVALAGTETREQKIDNLLKEWAGQLDARIRTAMKGERGKEGQTSIFFGINAFSDLEIAARDKFLSEVRGARYRVTLHDSNDEGDYHMYKIDWSGK
jgi:hypothetical protein